MRNIHKIDSGIVAVAPTDTVYGVVCLASDKDSVERLYKLKNRQAKPGTVIAKNIDQLVNLGIKRRYLKAVEHLWPNPISVAIPSEPSLRYLDMGLGSLAVRIPKLENRLEALLESGPLLTTSANPSEQPTAVTIEDAKKYFGNSVDLYIDGGTLRSKPSTLVRVVDDTLEVLRDGAISINDKGELSEPQ